MSRTLSILAISIGLSASACATGVNYPGTTQARQYELVSCDTDDWVYRESCNACEQGASAEEAPPVVGDSAKLSMLEKLSPTHPVSPVRRIDEEPVTP